MSEEPEGTPKYEAPDDGKLYELAVVDEIRKIKVRDEARKRYLEEKRQQAGIEYPEGGKPMSFFDALDEETEWSIEGLAALGHKVLFVAAQKVGKSTAIANLAYSLLEGEPFMNQFKVQKVDNVGIIDLELGKKTMARTLQKAGLTREHDGLKVWFLRGNANAFAIDSEEIRNHWVEQLSGLDVVIIDPLGPALDTMGIDENSSGVGSVLGAIDEIMSRAGVETYIVVHHAGHEGTRARGHSKLLGWPDAVWNYTRGESKSATTDLDLPRYFTAYGRDDVSVSKAKVTYDEGKLTYTNEAPSTDGGSLVDQFTSHLFGGAAFNQRQTRCLAYLGNGSLTRKELSSLLIKDNIPLGANGVLAKDLDTLVDAGKITKKKDGKEFIYELSPTDPS